MKFNILAPIMILVFAASLAPNHAEANFLKKLLGYDDYDDCIIHEMEDVDPKNKVLLRSIIKSCIQKFPKANPTVQKNINKKIVWKPMEVIELKCDRIYNRDTCGIIASLKNNYSEPVIQFKIEISKAGENCQTAKPKGTIYKSLYFPIKAYEASYNVHLGDVIDGGKPACFWIYGEFKE
jgi:hypothetical protein